MTNNGESLAQAAAVLRAGGLVGMPTETVYGLAADATDAEAVLRIFAAKGRPYFDPLIVHVADAAGARGVAEVDARAALLIDTFWPGPLTLVLPRRGGIPDLVTSGLETVGVRCPDHPLARQLITACGRPLAAPSANLFGHISPTTAAHVRDQFSHEVVPVVLDGGPCRVGVESTVLALDPVPLVLRPGGISSEALATCLGCPVALADTDGRARHLPAAAPGMLASHYAPRAPLRLRAADESWPVDPGIACIAFTGGDLPAERPRTAILSAAGDLGEAARNLFACMRAMDATGTGEIVAEVVPDHGIGRAINDRLRRAAGLG
jgi:L-threonylcarbamoyladenylate synthase